MKTLQRYIIIDRGKQEITDTDRTKRYTIDEKQMRTSCNRYTLYSTRMQNIVIYEWINKSTHRNRIKTSTEPEKLWVSMEELIRENK